MAERPLRRWFASADAVSLAALFCLCLGDVANLGRYGGLTLIPVTLGMLLAIAAVHAGADPAPRVVWAAGIAALALLGGYFAGLPGRLAAALAALLLVLALVTRRHLLLFPAAVAMFLPVFLVVPWGRSTIDVWDMLQAAAGALLRGQDPYGPTVSAFTAAGRPRLDVHLLYGPSVALLAVPGKLLGDVRLTSVAMFAVLFAAAIAVARERPRIAALCIALPLTEVMIMQAWVDVYFMAALAVWLALRGRSWIAAALVLGAGLATKPLGLAALLPLVVYSRSGRREVAVAAAAAAALVIPFALWTGPAAFYDDTVRVPLQVLPIRSDALTVNALLLSHGRPPLPGWVALAGAAVVAAVTLYRRPRDLADGLLAAAAITTAGLLLGRNAFFNYYFVPAALLLLALAARGQALDPEERGSSSDASRNRVSQESAEHA